MQDNNLQLRLFQYPCFWLGAGNGKDFGEQRFSRDVRGTGHSIFKSKNDRILFMNRGTFQEGKEKEYFLKATGTLNTMHIVSFRIICVQLLNPFDYVSFDVSCGLM